MSDDWKARHAFSIGQTVHAKVDLQVTTAQVLAVGTALVVSLRGEDEKGLWFASAAFPGLRLPVEAFGLTRFPTTASDDGEEGEA